MFRFAGSHHRLEVQHLLPTNKLNTILGSRAFLCVNSTSSIVTSTSISQMIALFDKVVIAISSRRSTQLHGPSRYNFAQRHTIRPRRRKGRMKFCNCRASLRCVRISVCSIPPVIDRAARAASHCLHSRPGPRAGRRSGHGSDRVRTKDAVSPGRGPVSTTRYSEWQPLVPKGSTRTDDDSGRPDSNGTV